MRGCAVGRQRGFSLLELLVAFVIMAMALGLLYRMAGGTARQSGEAEKHVHAVALAESLLNAYDGIPPGGVSQQGESAGLAWQVSTQPYATEVKDLTASPLHQMTVQVRWGEPGSVRLIELVTLLPQQKPLPGAVTK